MKKDDKIYVIGSNGGAGAAIVDQLLEENYTNVIGITKSGSEKWGRSIKVIKADATNKDELLKATKDAEYIFGAFNASEYSTKVWQAEFPLFMEAFINCGIQTKASLIFIDNLYMYSDQKGEHTYTEDTEVNPPTKKGAIRQAIAKQFLLALESDTIKGKIVRASDLYGPYALNSLIGQRFFEGIFKKNTAEVLPLGNNLHSFTYTRDFARLAVAAASDPNHPVISITPSGALIGYEDLCKKAYNTQSPNIRQNRLPKIIFGLVSLFMPAVKSLLEMEYEWQHNFKVESKYTIITPTPLDKGLQETVQWFSKYFKQSTVK